MRRARAENDFVVVSLFVNPKQFGPREDFGRYPRDFETDRTWAEATGVDVLFAPPDAAMYPPGYATYVSVDRLGDGLCGARRPGHFRGVATVVAKLFNICRPHTAYFGRKDYQQGIIIKRLAADLDFDLRIELLATVRETDGLAMSSRNAYLTSRERKDATAIYHALVNAQKLFAAGERRADALLAATTAILINAGARVDYVELVDAQELTPVTAAPQGALLAVAAFWGSTRLIDNTLLGVDDLTLR
jgi:pantoate--beta-alanine ligase